MQKTLGLVGGRGHTGAELIRLVARHPALELAFVSSRELDGERVSDHVDGAGLQRFAGFKTHDGAGRDFGALRQFAHAQLQSGSCHAALGRMHRYNVSSLT